MFTVSLMKRTEPSPMQTLTPPGWKLVALLICAASAPQPAHWWRQDLQGYCFEFGGTMVANIDTPVVPHPQRSPPRLVKLAPLVFHRSVQAPRADRTSCGFWVASASCELAG